MAILSLKTVVYILHIPYDVVPTFLISFKMLKIYFETPKIMENLQNFEKKIYLYYTLKVYYMLSKLFFISFKSLKSAPKLYFYKNMSRLKEQLMIRLTTSRDSATRDSASHD